MMAEFGDLVVFPKEFEDKLLEQSLPQQNETPLDLTLPKAVSSNPSQKGAGKPEQGTSILVKPKAVRPPPDEKFYKIGKLSLLLAIHNSYNDKFEIKGKDGNYVKNTDVIKMFKFSLQKNRRFVGEGLDDFYHQLTKVSPDILRTIIVNPIVFRGIELAKGRNDEIEREGDPESEPKVAVGPSQQIKDIKRKREAEENLKTTDFSTDYFTSSPPKKGKYIEESSSSQGAFNFKDWELPDLSAEIDQLFPDLN